MSYEPSLIIKMKDLQDNHDEICYAEDLYSKNEKKLKAYKELYNAIKMEPIVFEDKEFVIIQPELTSHNKAVRDLLDYLNIYYVLID
jgi:hypothetical protein